MLWTFVKLKNLLNLLKSQALWSLKFRKVKNLVRINRGTPVAQTVQYSLPTAAPVAQAVPASSPAASVTPVETPIVNAEKLVGIKFARQW